MIATGSSFGQRAFNSLLIGAQPDRACEHAFVSAGASSIILLSRAIEAGNLRQVRLVAAELDAVPIPYALRILLLIRDKEPDRFEPAAVKLAGRLMAKHPDVGLEGAAALLYELAALGSRKSAARRLADQLAEMGEGEAARVWGVSQ